MKRWFKTLAGRISPTVAIVMPPDGAAPRGFQGKNAFADQFNLIGPGARVIVDAGAHTGDSAVRYLELFASAGIHCFEPFPDSFARLTARFSGHSRVVPHQCALSDAPGESRFHTFVASVANSLLPAAERIEPFVPRDQMRETGVITVQNVTLDEFCRSARINRIDILKLDIQGGELRALKGAARLLSERRIRLVYAEVLFVHIYQGQAWFDDLAAFLRPAGYGLFDLYNFVYTESGQVKWGDAIFVPGD